MVNNSFESPKKKTKISKALLRSSHKKEVSVTIGQLYKKGIAHSPVRSGCVHSAVIKCTVSDFHHGRIVVDTMPTFGFIYLYDATGSISLGANYRDTALSNHVLPNEGRSDSAYCSFLGTITGTISWSPNRQDSKFPPFILSKGCVKKLELSLDGRLECYLPASGDVLNRLATGKYFLGELHKIHSFVGRIDEIIPQNHSVRLSVEDNCDFVAVLLTAIEDPEYHRNSKLKKPFIVNVRYNFVELINLVERAAIRC